MATWAEFEAAMPEMAAAGRALLYHFGPGLGYLATVRKDGGPRIHPICPVIVGSGLFAFIGPSPKRADLLRTGHYALHTFPMPDRDDEFFLTGRAALVTDAALRSRVYTAYIAQGTTTGEDHSAFEFGIDRALLSQYQPRDSGATWPPVYTRWRAP